MILCFENMVIHHIILSVFVILALPIENTQRIDSFRKKLPLMMHLSLVILYNPLIQRHDGKWTSGKWIGLSIMNEFSAQNNPQIAQDSIFRGKQWLSLKKVINSKANCTHTVSLFNTLVAKQMMCLSFNVLHYWQHFSAIHIQATDGKVFAYEARMKILGTLHWPRVLLTTFAYF